MTGMTLKLMSVYQEKILTVSLSLFPQGVCWKTMVTLLK